VYGLQNNLLDHLVGATEQRERECDAECLGGLEVDEKLDLSGLLDGQIGGLVALENPAGVDAGLTVHVRNTASVAHQAASRGELAILEDRGHRVAERQCGELLAPAIKERIASDHEPARSQLDQLCEGYIKVTLCAGIQDMEFQPEGVGRRQRLTRFGLGKSGIGRVDQQSF
jgi:hypothetical protein